MKRIELKYRRSSKAWVDGDDWIFLCDDGLRKHFDLPPKLKKLTLVLTKRSSQNRYKISRTWRTSRPNRILGSDGENRPILFTGFMDWVLASAMGNDNHIWLGIEY